MDPDAALFSIPGIGVGDDVPLWLRADRRPVRGTVCEQCGGRPGVAGPVDSSATGDGGAAGAALTAVGRTRHRQRALLTIAAVIVIIGIPAASSFYAYASVGRAHAKTPSQETAAYRMELIDKYVNTAMKHATWGYGRNTWPQDPTAPSIDNYYLLLCLMHGLIAVGLLLGIMVLMTVRLVRLEMRSEVTYPLGSSLGFTLAGIFVVYAVTIATVYMGLQTVPIFAIITGWSEGYLLGERYPSYPHVPPPPFSFRRIVA